MLVKDWTKEKCNENQLNADGQNQGKYSTSETGQMEKSTETRTDVQMHGGKKALNVHWKVYICVSEKWDKRKMHLKTNLM